jgi:acyl dehydratase
MNVFSKDFEALSEGERFVTRGRTIGEADITGFATLSGDTHPQHTDAEWGRAAASASASPTVCSCSRTRQG